MLFLAEFAVCIRAEIGPSKNRPPRWRPLSCGGPAAGLLLHFPMPLILAVVEFRVAATHFFTQRPQEDGYLLTQSHISFDDGILNGGDR